MTNIVDGIKRELLHYVFSSAWKSLCINFSSDALICHAVQARMAASKPAACMDIGLMSFPIRPESLGSDKLHDEVSAAANIGA